jgi:micrococcal nuclease
VVSVVDGDTIDVRINDRDVRVRYIGVNTPEQDQAFYSEATAYNQKLVGNKTVTLVKDTSETDPFNRLLRYVIVGDTFVNNELVAMGYAEASAYAPDTACVNTFETAQRKAQLVKVGLWMATPEVYIPAVTGGDATAICDLSYPGVCIPPAPPDLDCGDIQYRRFQVLPPDPHGFDRDGDGVGCES